MSHVAWWVESPIFHNQWVNEDTGGIPQLSISSHVFPQPTVDWWSIHSTHASFILIINQVQGGAPPQL